MLTVRVIPCLDVDNGRVVKGVRFTGIRDAGDPVVCARDYHAQGADEIVFLDIGATWKSRSTLIELVRQVANEVFIPLTVGGGIRSTDDMRRLLSAGADKVAICSAAVQNPRLVVEGADIFGSQCLVLSVDARKAGPNWLVTTHGGRSNSGRNVLEWVQECEYLGAGEILLNSIDRDGTQAGYDLELIRSVTGAVNIPVIASGGAGTVTQIAEAVEQGNAQAVLLASMLHDRGLTVSVIKAYLREKGVNVRW